MKDDRQVPVHVVDCKSASYVGKDKVAATARGSNGWWIVGGGIQRLQLAGRGRQPVRRCGPASCCVGRASTTRRRAVVLGFEYSAGRWSRPCAIAGELDGGLTRSNVHPGAAGDGHDPPDAARGIKFNMSGNADAYFIEGSDISKYDSAKQQWIQQGDDHRPVGQVQELRLRPGHPGLRLTGCGRPKVRTSGPWVSWSGRPSPSSSRSCRPTWRPSSVEASPPPPKMPSSSLRRARSPWDEYGRGRREERVGEVVVEEELAGVDLLAARVHLHMDVHGASLVPAGVDGGERRPAVAAADLGAPQERRVVGAGAAAARPLQAPPLLLPVLAATKPE